jgi:F-type H+-transporting ATPase subunit delta
MAYVAFQYGEALFSLALEQGNEESILKEYQSVLDGIDSEIYHFLNHPKITKEVKKQTFEKVVQDTTFLHFIYVLIDNNRIDLLEDVYGEYKKLYDAKNDVLEVLVTSGKDLTSKEQEQLIQSLEKKLKRTVKLTSVVDPKIVGGLKVEYEGMILDETINHHLNRLKASLLQ